MANKSQINWIQGGLAITMGLVIIFLLRKNWWLARLAGGFAIAFFEKWKESKTSQELAQILAQLLGRPPSEAGRKS